MYVNILNQRRQSRIIWKRSGKVWDNCFPNESLHFNELPQWKMGVRDRIFGRSFSRIDQIGLVRYEIWSFARQKKSEKNCILNFPLNTDILQKKSVDNLCKLWKASLRNKAIRQSAQVSVPYTSNTRSRGQQKPIRARNSNWKSARL